MNIKKILKPVLSIVLALVLGAAVIAMVGENPLSVYRSMLLGAFGSKMSIQKDSCWKPARIIYVRDHQRITPPAFSYSVKRGGETDDKGGSTK